MTFAELAEEIERRFNEEKAKLSNPTQTELRALRKRVTKEAREQLTVIK
jgi:hypothetical protein